MLEVLQTEGGVNLEVLGGGGGGVGGAASRRKLEAGNVLCGFYSCYSETNFSPEGLRCPVCTLVVD